MDSLPDRLSRRVAEELARVGDYGRVTLHVRAGTVTRIEATRSTMVVDENLQPPLSEVRVG